MNLKDQGIFLIGIKIKWFDDPALDFTFIEGRVVPQFFDGGQFLGGEEFAIERSEDIEFRISKRSDRDVARIGGRVILECEGIIFGHAEIAARIYMLGENISRTVNGQVGELVVALIGIGEEDAFAVGRPSGDRTRRDRVWK